MKFFRIISGRNKIILLFSAIVIIAVLGELAVDFSKKHPYGYFRNALWADRGGYYFYLPYLFNYDLDASKIPATASESIGKGFIIKNNKAVAKYPIGVAIMEAPFFGAAFITDFLAGTLGETNPFDRYYTKHLLYAPPFYTVIGLFLLFLSLRLLNIRPLLSLGLTVFVLLGTALFYYTVIEGLMSHSFTFFLFAAFTYLGLKLLKGEVTRPPVFWLALIIALIIMVRPFNVLLLFVYAISISAVLEWPFSKVKEIVLRTIPWLLVIVPVLIIPQLLYYNHAYGSWLVDSYAEESFNWNNPQILNVLISPDAGLFVYTPAMLVLFLSSFLQAFKKPFQFVWIPFFLIIILYIQSCWHSWNFGCGFGIRPYVDWLPLLIIPLAVQLNQNRKLAAIAVPAGLLVIIYTIRMSYMWTGCWFGDTISFSEFFKIFWT